MGDASSNSVFTFHEPLTYDVESTLSIRITSRLNSFQTLRKFSVLRCREMKNRSTVSLSIFTSLVCRHPSIFVSFPIALPAIADFIVHRTHMGYINQTLIPSQILLQLPTVLWSSRFLLFLCGKPPRKAATFCQVAERAARDLIYRYTTHLINGLITGSAYECGMGLINFQKKKKRNDNWVFHLQFL